MLRSLPTYCVFILICLVVCACARVDIESRFDENYQLPCVLDDVDFFDSTQNQVCIVVDDDLGLRQIYSNAIPNHGLDSNILSTIKPHTQTLSILLTPTVNSDIIQVSNLVPQTGYLSRTYFFGVSVSGILLSSVYPDFYSTSTSEPNYNWRINPLKDTAKSNIDTYNGALNSSNRYIYYGPPTALLQSASPDKHAELLGYAADGFPIYYQYGYSSPRSPNSTIKLLKTSYRLKSGSRPGGSDEPSGVYDGTYVGDYEYVSGLGDLDECNSRFGVTPEYPNGTRYYVVTDDFPYYPLCFIGTPDLTFLERLDNF